METLIIGAGAIGGLFGSRLTPFVPVTFFTTNGGHAAVMNRDGLALTCMDGSLRKTPVRVVTDPERYGRRADLVLVCTKSRATSQAAGIARQLLADHGLVLTLQNGLGNLEQLQDAVGVDRAAAGTTSQAATLLGPGHIRHAGYGPTVLAAGPGQEERIAAVAAVFNRAGIATTVTGDGEALLWSKLIVNVGINALSALLRVPNGTLAAVTESEAIMAQAVEEAEAVARALGIGLPEGAQRDRVRAVCAMTSANQSSMLQDVLKSRLSEIDAINGAIVRKGAEAGISTPVNRLLTQLVTALDATVAERIPVS